MGEPNADQHDGAGDEGAAPRRPSRLVVAGAVVAALAVVGVAIAIAQGGADDGPSAQGQPTATATEAPGDDAASTATPGPATPSPAPAQSPADTGSSSPAPEPAVTTRADGRQQLEPADLAASAEPAQGVAVTVAGLESVTGVAELPGEVGGPAVRATIRVENRTGSAVDLSAVVVNLYFGDALTPATTLENPGGQPFGAAVGAGKSATGRFVFRVPLDERARVRVEVDLSPEAMVVVFDGPAPE